MALGQQVAECEDLLGPRHVDAAAEIDGLVRHSEVKSGGCVLVEQAMVEIRRDVSLVRSLVLTEADIR
jgi:hypothetical protein